MGGTFPLLALRYAKASPLYLTSDGLGWGRLLGQIGITANTPKFNLPPIPLATEESGHP